MKHHKVFSRFKPFHGECGPGRFVDGFLGTQVRLEYARVPNPPIADTPSVIHASYPALNEEYFEWIDLLESVIAAKDSYTMIELGAGIGRWAVRAACAVEQSRARLPYRLIAVEAEPTHFKWMTQHFSDNGIDPTQHTLIHAAVSGSAGTASFYVGNENRDTPVEWFGQSLTKDYEVDVPDEEAAYCGYRVRSHASGARSITVQAVTLGSILEDLTKVDLVDSDLQGAELAVIRSSIDALDAKVKRLHIGTHSTEIERELRDLLSSHGWHCSRDYPCFSERETPFGLVQFQDGVQTWVNPRLAGPWGRPLGFLRNALYRWRRERLQKETTPTV